MGEEEERIVSLQVTLEQRLGFGVRSVLVRLVVIKVALGQFLLSVLQFFPVSITPPLHDTQSLMYHLRCVTAPSLHKLTACHCACSHTQQVVWSVRA